MELKILIVIKDTTVEVNFNSVENFERAIPAFIKNEDEAIKAQKLTKKIIKIHKTLSKLLE